MYKFEQLYGQFYHNFPTTSRHKTIAVRSPVIAFENFLGLDERQKEGELFCGALDGVFPRVT